MLRDESALLTAKEMQRLDLTTQEVYRIPGDVLMENAGQHAWAYLRDAYIPSLDSGTPKTIVFVAGSGNNGGDLLVMARQCLVEGSITPMIITAKDSLKGAMERQWTILSAFGVERSVWELDTDRCRRTIESSPLIVDGITGTGLTGPLRSLEATLVSAINASKARTIAIDVPSGMRDRGGREEPAITADLTISTGHRKRLLYAPARRERAGLITWVDPGFPPGAEVATTSLVDVEAYPRGRIGIRRIPADAHKGTRGRLTVVAGGDGTEGAAVLSGVAAGRTGVGMVRVVTTSRGCDAGRNREPGIMWVSAKFDEEIDAWSDALVLGPGWTDAGEDDLLSVLQTVAPSAIPVVLDAAALRLLPRVMERKNPVLPFRSEQYLVCTPHPGELAAIADVTVDTVVSDPFTVLDRAAAAITSSALDSLSPTIVLKGAATIVRWGTGRFSVVDGRCRGLGVAGSGDVLAGMIGGYLSTPLVADRQKRDDLVIDAIVEHLQRGRRLTRRIGAFSAGDLAEETIPPGDDS